MNRREALQALVALPAVKSVEVAQLRPTDTIVIEVDEILSPSKAAHISSVAEVAFPGQRVVVLERGMSVKVVRGVE